MIQWMLAMWSLAPLPFLNLAWTSGSSRFTYCWSLAWRILRITLPVETQELSNGEVVCMCVLGLCGYMCHLGCKHSCAVWYVFTHVCQSPAPAARESAWRDEPCWQRMMQPLTQGAGLHVYFKLQVLFYTLTKALGQRFDIFSSPSPRFIVSRNHCCPSNRVPASGNRLYYPLSTSFYVSYT